MPFTTQGPEGEQAPHGVNKTDWKSKLKAQWKDALKWKCSKCGKGFSTRISLYEHDARCKLSKEEIVKREEEWRSQSAIKRLCSFPPTLPLTLKGLALLSGVIAIWGLIIIISNIIDLLFQITGGPLVANVLIIVIGFLGVLFGSIFYYGFGRMKKWAFYLYGIMLVGNFIYIVFARNPQWALWQGVVNAIIALFFPIIIFIILLKYRKIFS